jgi:phytoene dehydrogenase-like protein
MASWVVVVAGAGLNSLVATALLARAGSPSEPASVTPSS